MLDPIEILQAANTACGRASMQPWDTPDKAALILTSAIVHLQTGKRHPALRHTTTDWHEEMWDRIERERLYTERLRKF